MSGTDFSDTEARIARLLHRLSEHERERSATPDVRPDLPRYDIGPVLGEGATAVVYRAVDRELKRDVAVKVSKDAAAATPTARERFRREAQAAAGLAHPNVVTVHDAGEFQGRPYLVLEVVNGRSLAEILKDSPPDQRRWIELLEQAARGVASAHAKGIIHRDLKPSNILVPASGEAKVGDFGLAHLADSATVLTRSGTPVGTPVYMSPEQVRGRQISSQTDVYSLGAILYEILAGRPPHGGETLAEVYHKILEEEPEPPRRSRPHLSPDLEAIALKALEKQPGRRYASAGDFAEDLRRFRSGEPTVARPAGPVAGLIKRLRKRAPTVAFVATIVAALAVTGAVWHRSGRRTELLEGEARREREEALKAMREMARTSVNAALNLRRKGATMPELRPFVQAMKDTYARAKARAPDSAEVEYLMGRMRRVVIDHETALDHQTRALAIDPHFAPALYERVVLISRVSSGDFWTARDGMRAAMGGVLPPDWVEKAGKEFPKFAKAHQDLTKDLRTLEHLLERGYAGEGLLAIGQAHLQSVRGIVAYWGADWEKARDHLRESVREDPLLEVAWEHLGSTLSMSFLDAPEPAEKLRRWQEAVECFDQAILNERGYPRLWSLRSALNFEGWQFSTVSGRDPLAALAAAERDATEACRLMPGQHPSWRQRARIRYTRAVYRKGLGEDPREDLLEAERCIQEAFRFQATDPENFADRGPIRLEKAILLEKAGERTGAESLYREAIADLEKAYSCDSGIAKRISAPLEEARTRLRALRP